jgi:hypothetical protein
MVWHEKLKSSNNCQWPLHTRKAFFIFFNVIVLSGGVDGSFHKRYEQLKR